MLATKSKEPTKNKSETKAKEKSDHQQSPAVNPVWNTLATSFAPRFRSPAGVPPPIQPKLTISQPNDPYEQEADRVADQVMRAREEDKIPSSELSVSPRSASTGEPLFLAGRSREPIIAKMEQAFGQSFGDIHLRTDRAAAQRASLLGVRAYTDGCEIGFAHGVFAPHTQDGLRTISHEFAHVAQLRGGSSAESRIGSRRGNHGAVSLHAIEAEAANAAQNVVAGRAARVGRAQVDGLLYDGPGKTTVPPPINTMEVRKEEADYVFTVSGATFKTWTNPLREVFAQYFALAYAAPVEVGQQCFDAQAKEFSWSEAPPDPKTVSDDTEMTFSIDVAAQKWAEKWIKEKKLNYKLIPPAPGPHPVKKRVTTSPGPKTNKGEKGSIPAAEMFDPAAELVLAPDPKASPYVTGADITAAVHFTNTEMPGSLYNFHPFNRRVDVDWTIKKGEAIVDKGPLLESSDTTYTFSLNEPSAHSIVAKVTSAYFRDGKELMLVAQLVAETEEARRAAHFAAAFVGTAPGAVFEVDTNGKLTLKKGATARSIDDELRDLNFSLGALDAAIASNKVSAKDAKEYRDYFQNQIDHLNELKEKTKNSKPYVARGIFQNRDDSSSREIKAVVSGRRVGVNDDSEAEYAIVAYDFTFTTGQAIQHAGTGTAAAKPDEQAGFAAAERTAVDNMADDWHSYNDYPDGSIQLSIQLLESADVKSVVIDTHNWKKPAKKVAAGVVIAGSIGLLAASGGTLAPVTVLIIEGATMVAGVALTAESVAQRIHNGTFKLLSSQTVLDMLSLVPLAGSFARMAGVAMGRGMVLLNITVGSASFVLIAEQTRSAIIGTSAEYAVKIQSALDADSKKKLEDERDNQIAHILGHAAFSGGLILVTTAVGAKQPLKAPQTVGKGGGKSSATDGLPPSIELPPSTPEAVAPPSTKPPAMPEAVKPPSAELPPPTPEAVAPPSTKPPAMPEAVKPPSTELPPPTPEAVAPPSTKPPAMPEAVKPPSTELPPPTPEAVTPPSTKPPAMPEAVKPPSTELPPSTPEAVAPQSTATPKVPTTGENWGIPEGGIPVKARMGKKGVKVPVYAQKNPGEYYYDPKSGKYPRRIGFPQQEGASHAIPCFPAGTPVATPMGQRAIEALQPGDHVYAYSETLRAVVVRAVLETHQSNTRRLVELSTACGTLASTSDHRLWVGNGDWTAARDVLPGDRLRTLAGEIPEVLSRRRIDVRDQPTYNLTVEGDFNYFAGNAAILVHNDGPYCIYVGETGTKNESYVGQTIQTLSARQAQHRREGTKIGSGVVWKGKLDIVYAKGPDGKLLTNLSEDEAHYWERKIYDRERAAGKKLLNRQVPYVDKKMATLIKKYCP